MQAKVQSLEEHVQTLQKQLNALEVEKVRDRAQLEALDEYVSCAGAFAPPKQSPAPEQHVEQLRRRNLGEQVRATECRIRPFHHLDPTSPLSELLHSETLRAMSVT